MKNMRAITIGVVLAASVGAIAQSNVQATLQDIHRTLGSLPDFFKAMPPDALPGAWQEMKAIELSPNTALPAKTKELIGLAVAAQIPCRYCVYFHTASARMHGATDEELREATAVSALSREWSTVLNGAQLDMRRFKREVGMMLANAGRPQARRPMMPATDAASAYQQMNQMFGFVPTFARMYPASGIAGLWNETRTLYFSPNTALDDKTKNLISLAVSAQTPCSYCIVLDTGFARGAGATEQEMGEAIAMAGLTRHWSTMLNGAQIDERQFRTQVDRLMQDMQQRMNRRATR
jgi:AhpD family alkylhydroperoxidase